MNAEIIAVGTELLLGDIVNTNAQYLAKELANLGINVFHQSVVGDNVPRLKEEFGLAFSRSSLIITTGGLGPTKDDLTKETGAEFFNKKLVLHDESFVKLKEHFNKLNRVLNEGNIKQAYFPEDSIILPNNYGTAPGCIMEEDGKILVVLPGPPKEMKPMFDDYVVPYLKKFQNSVLFSKVLRICGIGEGHMAEQIADIIEGGTNPTVAPYAKEGEVTLRITARAASESEAKSLIAPVEKEIRKRLGINVYGTGDTSLEAIVGELLIANKLTIAVAESCTGGLLTGRLVNYPGISEVLMEGAVTYSNEAKMRMLGVKKETLDTFGAVSKETAAEMAAGAALAAGTRIGLSTTGIAGPDGGTPEKPVGLVYIGLYIDGKVTVRKLLCPGDRQSVRNRTVVSMLDLLRREIIEHLPLT